MAYKAHTLLVFGGTLTDPTTAEKDIWQCTIRACDPTLDFSGPILDPVAYMNEVAPQLSAWFQSQTAYMCTYASLDFFKVNSIGPDGKYSDPGTNQHDYASGLTGSAAPVHPFTESFVYSWTTPKKRGPGSHGRIYPPNACLGAPGSASIIPGQQQLLLASAQGLVDVLDNGASPDNPAALVVASKVNATNTSITGVRVGRIVDSQRRRRNALTEVYINGPV